MSTQHTPGPWEASFHQTANGTPFGIVCGGTSQDGRFDLVICHGPDATDEPTSFDAFKKNARLIAAAPDLLEALKVARHMIVEDGTPIGWSVSRLDEVIAKSTEEKK